VEVLVLDIVPPQPVPQTIIVTARALPDPESERAYAVDRISESELRDNPRTQLDEVLKQIPGLQLFRRSDSQSGHPTSQGVTLRALGGNASSRALLLLDGVPQSDPFGGWINWPAYDPAALAEVRVVRGGGSVAYGPGALAGVIDMVSSIDRGWRAGIDVGSRQSVEGRGHLGASLGGGVISLSVRGGRGDGFIPITHDTRGPADQSAPYKEASLRSHWVGPVGDKLELQLSGDLFTDRRDRGLDFTANRTDGADASLRLVGRGRWQFAGLVYGQWRELRSSFASVDAGRSIATRVSLQDSVPSQAVGGSFELRPPMPAHFELRIGSDARRSEGESRELFAYVGGEPTRRRVAGGNYLTVGTYGEATMTLGRLTLSGGARLDHWRVSDGELREWVLATGAPLRDERFGSSSGWRPTARVGAVIGMGQGWSVRSTTYLGWRPPTLNELFRPFRAGADATAANAELNPERLSGLEAGVNFEKAGATLSLTAFANRLQGAIANVTLGHGPGAFPGVGFVAAGGEYRQRQNLDAIGVRGVEASTALRRGPWTGRVAASLVHARVDSDGAAARLDGLRPAQTPSLSLIGSIGWEKGRRGAVMTVRHVGNQYEDDLNQRRLPAATTVDAFVAWPIFGNLDLVMRGDNLLDERVVAGIGGDGAVERAAPRTLWLGLRFAGKSN
jgi:outer membrane receptor protein involved in Fe transport